MNSPKYKYANETKLMCNCPPESYQPIQTAGFRLCFSDLNYKQNYLPRATKANSGNASKNAITCEYFGLSFYTSEAKLKKAFKAGTNYAERTYKRLGDHFIKVKLDENSGTQTKPSSRGHFDLHEFSTFDCKLAIETHKRITQ